MNAIPKQVFLGVDIGGSHISIGIFAKNSSELLCQLDLLHAEVDAEKEMDEILQHWHIIGHEVGDTYNINKIGIAFPAPFDYKRGVCLIKQQGKFRSLFGLNLKETIADLWNVPASNILFLNDAESYLRGELHAGTVGVKQSVLLLTFGTGLGSAWKIGEVFRDAGLWSIPFLDGIAEDYFGTRWFTSYAFQKFHIEVSNVKDLVSNPAFSSEANLIFQEFTSNLALFIKLQYQKTPFDALILGGNISKAHSWFLGQLENQLLQNNIHISIHLNQLGKEAPVYGAASYILKN